MLIVLTAFNPAVYASITHVFGPCPAAPYRLTMHDMGMHLQLPEHRQGKPGQLQIMGK